MIDQEEDDQEEDPEQDVLLCPRCLQHHTPLCFASEPTAVQLALARVRMTEIQRRWGVLAALLLFLAGCGPHGAAWWAWVSAGLGYLGWNCYSAWQRYQAQGLCSLRRRLQLTWTFFSATETRGELETATVCLRGASQVLTVVIFPSGIIEPADTVMMPADGLQDVVQQLEQVALGLDQVAGFTPVATRLRHAAQPLVKVLSQQKGAP